MTTGGRWCTQMTGIIASPRRRDFKKFSPQGSLPRFGSDSKSQNFQTSTAEPRPRANTSVGEHETRRPRPRAGTSVGEQQRGRVGQEQGIPNEARRARPRAGTSVGEHEARKARPRAGTSVGEQSTRKSRPRAQTSGGEQYPRLVFRAAASKLRQQINDWQNKNSNAVEDLKDEVLSLKHEKLKALSQLKELRTQMANGGKPVPSTGPIDSLIVTELEKQIVKLKRDKTNLREDLASVQSELELANAKIRELEVGAPLPETGLPRELAEAQERAKSYLSRIKSLENRLLTRPKGKQQLQDTTVELEEKQLRIDELEKNIREFVVDNRRTELQLEECRKALREQTGKVTRLTAERDSLTEVNGGGGLDEQRVRVLENKLKILQEDYSDLLKEKRDQLVDSEVQRRSSNLERTLESDKNRELGKKLNAERDKNLTITIERDQLKLRVERMTRELDKKTPDPTLGVAWERDKNGKLVKRPIQFPDNQVVEALNNLQHSHNNLANSFQQQTQIVTQLRSENGNLRNMANRLQRQNAEVVRKNNELRRAMDQNRTASTYGGATSYGGVNSYRGTKGQVQVQVGRPYPYKQTSIELNA